MVSTAYQVYRERGCTAIATNGFHDKSDVLSCQIQCKHPRSTPRQITKQQDLTILYTAQRFFIVVNAITTYGTVFSLRTTVSTATYTSTMASSSDDDEPLLASFLARNATKQSDSSKSSLPEWIKAHQVCRV